MIGFPYINSLFTSILTVSKVIGGRFFICPKLASEINSANINEIVIAALPNAIKYPVALMMPAIKSGNFQFSGDEVSGPDIGYNNYFIQMMFLRGTTNTAYNQPSIPLPGTQIATHTAVDCWHDMSRCAEDFLQVLRQVLINNGINALIISEQGSQFIKPITDIGNDKVSGALLTFNLKINGGCDIEDYPSDYLDVIELPSFTDTHPTHINS